MLLRRIEISGFRNLSQQALEPGPRLNVLWGANAQGKTNLLEAVYLLACLRSFRAHRSVEMVQFGRDEALLQATAHAQGVTRELEVRLHRGGRRALVDGKGVRNTTTYLEGGLNVVLFTPDDVQLPRGSPAQRRQLVDRAITNLWPAYLGLAREYQRTVQSRNRVLRERPGRQQNALLEVYDQQLSERGARLVAARLRYLDGLAPRFSGTFASISGDGVSGTLHYVAQGELLQAAGQGMADLAAVLLRGLERSRATDRARQSTTVGPHTHDVEFRLDGRSTRSVGSQGQHRALMLAFKMAQIGDAHEKLGDYPILLLDDVSSELDPIRNTYLFDFIKEISCQTLLTTTRADLVDLTENRVDFQVVNGTIRPAN